MYRLFSLRNFAYFSIKRHICQRIEQAMRDHGIIPDVISTAPKEAIKVKYPCGAQVNKGNILTPTEVSEEPSVDYPAQKDKFYLLCLTDPDAPSRKEPKYREWHHWLVGNIPQSKVEQGKVLSAYIGAGPPQNSGLHRYVFLVYQQPEELGFCDVTILTNKSAAGRGNFKIQNFCNFYNLGNPIAGNFFQAEYDDYVPILYKKLSGS